MWSNVKLSGGQYFGIKTEIIHSVRSCVGLGGRASAFCLRAYVRLRSQTAQYLVC